MIYLGALRSAAPESVGVLRGHLQHLGVEVGESVACVSDALFESNQRGDCIGLVSFKSKTGLVGGNIIREREREREI